MGIYVIAITLISMATKKGIVDLYIVGISSLNLYADKNKFIPTGGVKNPSSRLAIKIIAK